MDEKNITVKINTGTIIKGIFIILLFISLYFLRNILTVVFLSVVIASSVEPMAAWFQRRKIPRTLAVIFIYLAAFTFLGIIFYLVVPVIFEELSFFSTNITDYLNGPVQKTIFKELSSTFPVSISKILQEFSIKGAAYISGFATGFFQTTSKIFGGVISFILIIVLSFYLSVQERGIEKFLRIIVPLKYEDYIIDLWLRVRRKIGFWLQGQLLLAVIVAILIFLGLTILGINYALTFSLLAGAFEIIPVFGPILASIPPILLSLLHDPILALKVAILFIVVQQFENHLIYPLVVKKIIGIQPIITILALVVGAELAGFMGILLSVPISTALVEILDDFDKHKRSK
jgi:predicted PurR-regulated permease PerM